MDMKQNEKETLHKTSYSEYVEAFVAYLKRPKTIFDLKDRAKAAALMGLIIILLQMVVERLIN